MSDVARRGMRVVVLLAACLFVRAAGADDLCVSMLPDVAADVARSGLPTQASRWIAAERLWSEVAEDTDKEAQQMLANGSLSPASDVIQGRTQDLLREAILQHRDALADSLIALWLKPLSTLSPRTTVKIYYVTPAQYLSDVALDRPYEMWVGADGIENILYSAIYLAGATDIVKAIARRTPETRTPRMKAFAQQLPRIAIEHYLRWAFGPPGIWQVRGWGCDASGLDLIEFTRRRMEHDLHGASYCASPTSVDLLLTIGIANILDVCSRTPDLVSLSAKDRTRLADLLDLLSRFLASRLVYDHATDAAGHQVEVVDFDPGSWSPHSDFAFAGDSSPNLPNGGAMPSPAVGWDISHGARIAWALQALADTSRPADKSQWNRALDGLAHQLAIHVLDDGLAVPRFRNYLDGSNGWYRVSEAREHREGVPPFGLSLAFLAMPWAILSPRDPQLMNATSALWKALTAPTKEQCTLIDSLYFRQTYRSADQPPRASRLDLVWRILPFLAVSSLQ